MDSFIPRIGGKRLLRKEILKRFPEATPDRYVEPFGGAGWVLFSSDRHAPEEIFNDIDGELINLFRCVKFHCEELQRQLAWALNSREVFNDALQLKDCSGLTDIQRAANHFLVVKESYGADGRSYGASAKNLDRVTDYLSKIRQRLMHVKIENRDYAYILQAYDRPGALFYLDPPYHGTEKYYDAPFSDDEHRHLNGILKQLKGSFILSYNDDAFIRNLYQGFNIESVSRASNLTHRYPELKGKYQELIIRNF